jgi:hypothetical protein
MRMMISDREADKGAAHCDEQPEDLDEDHLEERRSIRQP